MQVRTNRLWVVAVDTRAEQGRRVLENVCWLQGVHTRQSSHRRSNSLFRAVCVSHPCRLMSANALLKSAISTSVFNILNFKVQVSNIFLSGVLTQLGNPALSSLLGSRMLFNMKEAAERGLNEGTNYRTPPSTMSEMDFAEPANPHRYCSKFSFFEQYLSEYKLV